MNQQHSSNSRNKDRKSGKSSSSSRSETEKSKPQESPELLEKVIKINRCAKVVKGGRRFSFSALVVVGDQKGRFGMGHGKAKEVPDAIRKATDEAHKNLELIQLKNNTIPHAVVGKSDGGLVMLKPASPGTGIIAGAVVGAVLEALGVKDILTKSLGSNNPYAMVNATIAGLRQLRTAEQIALIKSV